MSSHCCWLFRVPGVYDRGSFFISNLFWKLWKSNQWRPKNQWTCISKGEYLRLQIWLPGTLNNHLQMDGWWKTKLLHEYNDLESSSWNNQNKKIKNNDWLSGTRMYQAFKGYQFLKFFMQVTYHGSQTRPNFTLKKNCPLKFLPKKKHLRCLRKVRLGRNRNYKGGPKKPTTSIYK